MIQCSKCGETRERATPRVLWCRECFDTYHRNYRKANREKIRGKQRAYHHNRSRTDAEYVSQNQRRGREYWATLRHEAILAYGGYSCVCCGETGPKFLTLDHINNDGAKHRREMGYANGNGKGASSATLKWLKDNGYPPIVQVLCMNCNLGKQRNGGICPHKENSQSLPLRPQLKIVR